MESTLMKQPLLVPETLNRWLRWCHEAQAGNRASWDQFLGEVREFFEKVADHKRKKRPGEPEASDVAQIACVKVLEALDGFRGTTGEELAGWLLKVVHHTYLDAKRS